MIDYTAQGLIIRREQLEKARQALAENNDNPKLDLRWNPCQWTRTQLNRAVSNASESLTRYENHMANLISHL